MPGPHSGVTKVRTVFLWCLATLPPAIAAVGYFWPLAHWSLLVVGPLLALGVADLLQKQHTLRRIYPVIGWGRYLMEGVRPEIQQYFVESNIDGKPFSREQRSLVYQRAKGDRDTMPFGTQQDVYRPGYEWMAHSLAPKEPPHEEPRIRVGGPDCRQPYEASIFNISAMSFGSLSRNAVLALNKGAKLGGFCHNTGEGGLSPYHLEHGGDVIWQIGTGYFGCRTPDGEFSPEAFTERATRPAVTMVEIKLSQGAKPGHGGILPGKKVTPEIAEIRGVEVGKDVLSPPAHRAFSGPTGLLHFVAKLRDLSGGKPIGFKLCIGDRSQFLAICKAMQETEILPDFITVDGAEGGTGAAPVEFSNYVGMPLADALVFVHNALTGIGVRDLIRIVASGKIVSGFDIFRTLALGADLCNSARGMMLALGCIQARKCDANDCPVGVATQDPVRSAALDVSLKSERVHRYHDETIKSFLHLLGAAGMTHPSEIRPHHVMRRVSDAEAKGFDELYGFLERGALLSDEGMPDSWSGDWRRAKADRF